MQIKINKYLFSLIFFLVSLNSCSPIFLLKASLFEAKILLKRKEISEMLKQETVEQETKEKLKLVLEARKFSKDIGLKPKGSFSKYSKVDSKNLLWVLSAAKKDKFEAKLWWFPVVGSIPYKGFFSKEDALKESEKLENNNYDTYLRPSDAFSTLGWFDDPILSTTLSRQDLILVNTVIHEIVHNTIWVKNNAYYNETMANAIAAVATIEFFKDKDQKSHEQGKNWLARELKFSVILNNTIEELKLLYSKEIEETEKSKQKEVIFSRYIKDFEKISNKRIKTKANNAYLLAQEIYYKKFPDFIDKYKYNGNSLKKFISYLKEISNSEKPYNVLSRKN